MILASISLSTGDSWYKKLQETIDRQQKQALWVSEAKVSCTKYIPHASRWSVFLL